MIFFFPSSYTSLVTTEHQNSPKYLETLTVTIQPFTDNQTTVFNLPEEFDLDGAIGAQLDAVGVRIGLTRYVKLPIPDVFFSLDIDDAHGLDNARWFAGDENFGGTATLSDPDYRTFLRARIIMNGWDGTAPGAQAAYDLLFADRGVQILIQDYGFMQMALAIRSTAPIDDVTMGLFVGDYLPTRPMAVQLTKLKQSDPVAPFFGLDVENNNISGLDVGAWAVTAGE